MTTTTATTATVPTRTSTISIAAPSTIRVQVPNPVSAPVTTTTSTAAAPVPTPVPVQIPTSIGQGQVPTPVTIAPNAVGNTAIVAPSTTSNKIASTITHVTHHPAKPTPVLSAPTSTTTTTTTTATTHMATATVKTVPVAQPIHVNKSMTTRKMNQRHVTNTTNTTVSPVPSSTTSTRSSKSSPKKKKHKIPMPTTSGGSSNTSASENTGRWTTEEHRLFLQGLEQHGKGWKKIASLIKSRTVVQIRTHAQKYFQKMAKARQNGETTEETVVSHGGNHIVSHSIRHGSKRKKNGNKRKAIASVVHSAVKERKTKKKRTASASTVTSSTAEPEAAPVEPQIQSKAEPEGFPVSMVSTVLVPYTYPPIEHDGNGTVVTAETTVPSITTAHGTISGAALEESLFRFLTPMPNDYVNDVARQAGANSITLPSGNPNKTALDGEVSPSGVVDFPSDWAWSTEPPSWYAKGADVDELLNEADALDWLADTGDLQEAYTPPDSTKMTSEPSLMSLVENPSTASVVATSTNEANNEPMLKEHVAIKKEEVAAPIPVLETSNNMASIASNGNMPLLPSMFDSDNHLAGLKKESSVNERLASSASLFAAASEGADAVVDADNFKLLDDHFEDEQAFVTALLDHPNDSSANLNHLGAGDNNHQ
jgi:SHAQKYF class myb-like DNA-binding protein